MAATPPAGILSTAAVRAAAHASRFALVGLARAVALDPVPLERWLAAGYAADMQWMHERRAERLDPGVVLPGARTVIALAVPYDAHAEVPREAPHEAGGAASLEGAPPLEGTPSLEGTPPLEGTPSPIARYARGRDYHYAHRDGLKALRRRLLALDPTLATYACVDTGVAMEKVWAERAGLGWIGKNGCLIHPRHGSWLTLSVLFVDREVDAYDVPQAELCGECDRCLRACPTRAFPSPGVVDARLCISYQTIENPAAVPAALRPRLKGHAFGCDVCQEVCPFNQEAERLPADPRVAARPVSALGAAELAALSAEDFERLATGTALQRPGYAGMRRNALYALGAARESAARAVVERLTADPDPVVAEAARWALERIDRAAP